MSNDHIKNGHPAFDQTLFPLSIRDNKLKRLASRPIETVSHMDRTLFINSMYQSLKIIEMSNALFWVRKLYPCWIRSTDLSVILYRLRSYRGSTVLGMNLSNAHEMFISDNRILKCDLITRRSCGSWFYCFIFSKWIYVCCTMRLMSFPW